MDWIDPSTFPRRCDGKALVVGSGVLDGAYAWPESAFITIGPSAELFAARAIRYLGDVHWFYVPQDADPEWLIERLLSGYRCKTAARPIGLLRNKALFIGGPLDGQVRDDPGHSFCRFIVNGRIFPLVMGTADEIGTKNVPAEKLDYLRSDLGTGCAIYRSEKIPPWEELIWLMKWYLVTPEDSGRLVFGSAQENDLADHLPKGPQ